VTPPNLTADAPVLDVIEPLLVLALPHLGYELRLTPLHRLKGLLGQGLHANEPLFGIVGFHHSVTTIAMADVVLMRLNLNEEPWVSRSAHYFFPGREAVQPLISSGVLIQTAVRIEDC